MRQESLNEKTCWNKHGTGLFERAGGESKEITTGLEENRGKEHKSVWTQF